MISKGRLAAAVGLTLAVACFTILGVSRHQVPTASSTLSAVVGTEEASLFRKTSEFLSRRSLQSTNDDYYPYDYYYGCSSYDKDACKDASDECVWERDTETCIDKPPECVDMTGDQAGCVALDYCFYLSEDSLCLDKCSEFDKEKDCGETTHCDWFGEFCGDKCSMYSDEESDCTSSECLWSKWDDECVADCGLISQNSVCKDTDHCEWNKGTCEEKPPECDKLSRKNLCDSADICNWSEDESECLYTCDMVEEKGMCSDLDYCVWEKNSCADKPPECDKLSRKNLCDSADICNWSEDESECLYTCDMVEEKGMCSDLDYCVWEKNSCADKPPECDKLSRKKLCDSADICNWSEDESECLYICDMVEEKGMCSDLDYCVWEKNSCADKPPECNEFDKAKPCDKQDHCSWMKFDDMCGYTCSLLNKKECGDFDYCEYSSKDKSCSEKPIECPDLNKKKCDLADGTCLYNKDIKECQIDCTTLDKNTCGDYDICEFTRKDGCILYVASECEGVMEKKCDGLDTCKWNGKECADVSVCLPESKTSLSIGGTAKACKQLNQKKCNKDDSCEWDEKKGKCNDAPEDTCEGKNEKKCAKEDTCKYSGKKCVDVSDCLSTKRGRRRP